MNTNELEFNPNDEGFNLLKDVAEGFNEQRYINGYYDNGKGIYEIRILIIDLERSAKLMELENEMMKKCEESFLNSFASDDTNMFRHRIDIPKATLLAVKTFVKILKDSKKKNPKRPGQISNFNKDQSLLCYSPVSSPTYQTSTISFSTLPDYHQQLFAIVKRCLFLVNETIDTCTQILIKENENQKNPEWLKFIHDDQVHALKVNANKAMDLKDIIRVYENKPDPIYDAYLKSSSMDEFLTNYYHVFNQKNMIVYVMNIIIREAKKNDLYFSLRNCIPQEKMEKVIFVIEHLDSFKNYLPVEEKNSAKLARFFIWINPHLMKPCYDALKSLCTNVTFPQYDYLTSIIKKQRSEYTKQVEQYCNDLDAKIEKMNSQGVSTANDRALKSLSN